MNKRKSLSHVAAGFLSMSVAAAVTLAASAGGRAGGGIGGAAAAGRGRGGPGGGGFGAAAAPRAPAPTLQAPTTPTTRPDEEGFIRRWILLEPMPAQGVSQIAFQALVKKEHFPHQFTLLPRDGEKVVADGSELTWHAYDTTRYNVNLYHFSYALYKPTNNVCWWAVSVVNAPEEMKDVRLAVGSNDASVWWLNGEELIGLYGNRMDTFDDGVSKKITLKKGSNILRAAIGNEMGPSDFCARFLDNNDVPVKNLTISLDDPTK